MLESFDNGEWLTGVVLETDSATLKKFVRNERFQALPNLQDLHLISNNYLVNNKANFVSADGIYFITKSSRKHNWTYVVDLSRRKLWAEISYPDWSEN